MILQAGHAYITPVGGIFDKAILALDEQPGHGMETCLSFEDSLSAMTGASHPGF